MAHWISKDWKLLEILVDFSLLSGAHSEENLAKVFEHCCWELDILTKIYVTKFFVYTTHFCYSKDIRMSKKIFIIAYNKRIIYKEKVY